MPVTLAQYQEIAVNISELQRLLNDYKLARTPGEIKVVFRSGYHTSWSEQVRKLAMEDLRGKAEEVMARLSRLDFDVSTLETEEMFSDE